MELRQLDTFVAVAEERHFTRAAVRLHVAQTGVSATIRKLERELGAPLFVRTTRRVALTPAGSALLVEARRTLAAATAAVDAVAAVQGLRRGTLTLGIMQATSLFGLPDLLADYQRTYPGIELKLHHARAAELGRLLTERSLDIAFRSDVGDELPDVVSLPLARSPLVFVCHPDDELAHRPAIELGVLAGRRLVGFPTGWAVRDLADQAMRSSGVDARYGFEVNDTDSLFELVEAGLGAALVPDVLASPRAARLRRAEIRGRRWEWVVAAQALAPEPGNPAARALWAMLAARGHTPPASPGGAAGRARRSPAR